MTTNPEAPQPAPSEPAAPAALAPVAPPTPTDPPVYAAPPNPAAPPVPQGYGVAPDPLAKSKLAAGLLGILLGMFGAHRFYLGYTKRGVIILIVTFVGSIVTLGLAALAMSLFGIFEGIMYLTGNPKYSTDATGRPLRA